MQWRLYRLYRRWIHSSFDTRQQARWLRAARLTLLAANTLIVASLFFSELGYYDAWVVQAFIIYPGGFFFGAVVLGFLLVSTRDLVVLVSSFMRRVIRLARRTPKPVAAVPRELDGSRRRFLKTGGMAALAGIGGIPAIASLATARDYQVNRIPLYFESLPTGLEGLTIAQVSDIHSGVYMTEEDMREIFEIVNDLNPELIMLTGDQVDNSDSQIPSVQKAVTMLRSEYGVYGCLGNHDHFATAPKVTAALEESGIVVLNNEHRTLRINGEPLSIVGIDDAGRGARNFAGLDLSLRGLQSDSFKVLLTHRPGTFPLAKKAGIDLSLAGHTHGGQVGIECFGLNLNPIYLVYDYAKGLYKEEGKYLYVNVGVGMVGVPIRLVKPEIALFTLHSRG